MQRIAIVGNGGGGKTTAGRRLSSALNIPLYSVDQVQWEPGWVPASPYKVQEWHDSVLAKSSWILDGWGDMDLIAERLKKAEAILMIDFSLEDHLAGARLREQMAENPDAPPGCSYQDIRDRMTQTIERVDRELMPRLRQLVEAQQGERIIYWARNPADRELAVLRLLR